MDRVEREIAALGDANPYKREYAAAALGASRDPRAIGPLIECLRDHRGMVRESATHSLVTIGAAAVEPVIKLLVDPDPDTRQVAAEILGRIGDRGATTALAGRLRDGHAAVRREAARGLGRLGDAGSIDALLNALSDRSPGVRSSVARALGHIPDARAFEGLLAALNDRDAGVRSEAASALGGSGRIEAAQALARSLDDEQPWVRWHALQALAVLAGTEPLLQQAVSNTNATVRMDALFALGERRDGAYAETLRAALDDPVWGVRWHAVRALGQIAGEGGLADLARAADDPDPRVADIARRAAAGILAAPPLPGVSPIAAHLAALADADEASARVAADTLGEAADLNAVGPLILALHDPYPQPGLAAGCAAALFYAVYARLTAGRAFPSVARAEVARALARRGDPRAIEPLMAALRDGEPSVRIAAAEGLARFADPQALGSLSLTLRDRHPAVRDAAREALAVLQARS